MKTKIRKKCAVILTWHCIVLAPEEVWPTCDNVLFFLRRIKLIIRYLVKDYILIFIRGIGQRDIAMNQEYWLLRNNTVIGKQECRNSSWSTWRVCPERCSITSLTHSSYVFSEKSFRDLSVIFWTFQLGQTWCDTQIFTNVKAIESSQRFIPI